MFNDTGPRERVRGLQHPLRNLVHPHFKSAGKKKKKKKRTLQRIRAPLQSSQQNKVETHCRAKTSVRRSKVGLLARNKVLLKELEIRKDKMKSVKN